jgi:hypothetical protein
VIIAMLAPEGRFPIVIPTSLNPGFPPHFSWIEDTARELVLGLAKVSYSPMRYYADVISCARDTMRTCMEVG